MWAVRGAFPGALGGRLLLAPRGVRAAFPWTPLRAPCAVTSVRLSSSAPQPAQGAPARVAAVPKTVDVHEVEINGWRGHTPQPAPEDPSDQCPADVNDVAESDLYSPPGPPPPAPLMFPVDEAPAGTTVVHDKATAERALKVLYSDKVRKRFHACDTECADIEAKKQSPVGHGRVICATLFVGDDVDFGNGPRLWIDNLDGDQGANTMHHFKEYFEDPSILKVWHNYSFDRHVIYNHGINVLGFGGDTMQMARLWDASRMQYSLEALTKDIMGQDVKKNSIKELFGRAKLKKDGTEGKIIEFPDLEEVQRNPEHRQEWMDYATYDAEVTWNLRERLQSFLEDMAWAPDKDGNMLNMWHYYFRYWRPFGEILTDMEREGIYVRRDEYLPLIRERAQQDLRKAEREFQQWAVRQCPDAAFMNISSDAQKQQLFFGPYFRRGEVIIPAEKVFTTPNVDGYIEPGRTKPRPTRPFTIKGLGIPVQDKFSTAKLKKPQVSLTVLRELAGSKLDSDNPSWGLAYDHFGGGAKGAEACRSIESLCRVSAIETLLQNFIESLGAQCDHRSRVHCSLNLNTETGRLSARRPNLQNQPALEKDIYKIRDAFGVDPSSGNILIVADYGQLELRLLAHISRCESMIRAFKEGGDFHSRTAIGMYPHVQEAVEKNEALLEWDDRQGAAPKPLLKDVFSSERRRAKTLNFSIAYGKTSHGLSKDWNVSQQEATETVDRWYSDRPEVRRWQEEVIEYARKHNATRTLMGRWRPLPDINSDSMWARGHAERAAINTPLQGGAADVMMMAMLKLSKHEELAKMGWKMLMQIHDEVILEGPEKYVKEAMAILHDCMSHPFKEPLLVDLVVDAKADYTWYAAK